MRVNDPGTESEALQAQHAGEMGDQEEYDAYRLERLEKGYHVTAAGPEIRLRAMEDRHLANTIRYGQRCMRDREDSADYWAEALPVFEAEKLRRTAR